VGEVFVLKKAMFALGLMVCAGLPEFRISAQFGPPRSEQTEQQRELEQRREREANKKRQEEIREDTQKLYQLASELKEAVDKTNENVLSLAVVKKAEEVERLAKRVKEKMREGVGKPLTPEMPPVRPPIGPG
jgi:hypothetical protein